MQQQPSSRRSWPSGDDDGAFYLVVILVCAAVGGCLLWDSHHGLISRMVMQVYHAEIGVLRHVTDRFDLADRQMLRINPERVTLRDLGAMARDIGSFVAFPVAGLVLALALLCLLRAAPARFRRAFDLQGLLQEQARSYPVTAAFLSRPLGLVAPAPADPRPADYALTPGEWIARYASKPDGTFDPVAAKEALVRQLGPRWRGPDMASPHARGMFAVFALHLAERRTEANALLGRVSEALGGRDAAQGPSSPLSFPRAVADDVAHRLRDPSVLLPALAIAGRHAYAHTALMGLLAAARSRSGVLAPAQFAWLKLVDRPLWYALHSLGFETESADRYVHPNPRTEAAGVRGHWAIERLAGRPVPDPDVSCALQALRRVAEREAHRSQAAP